MQKDLAIRAKNRLTARLLRWYSLFLACAMAPAFAGPLNISLILSDNTPPYQQFSDAFSRALAGDNIIIEKSLADARHRPNESNKADLTITVGMKAAEHAAASHNNTPLLSVMIPKSGYEALLADYSPRYPPGTLSAIYLNQSWERQFSFIRAVLPKHDVVGVLYSPNMPVTLPRLPRGMSINAKSVRSSEALFDALEYILSSSDVLLVIPDSEIYTSSNVRNILLTSYRYKVPLIGISQSYVNAGALGAIFTTPEQLADQAAELAVSFARLKQLPEPQYPAQFSIALNPQVARSLGISLNSPETIRERMGKAGEGER